MAKKKISKAKVRQIAPPPQPSEAKLQRALTGEVDDIRPADALMQLNARGVSGLTGLLVDIAIKSEDIDLRATAAQALGQAATAKHRATLLRVLDDEEPEVARRAAEGLARIGGEVELKRLRALRTHDPVLKRAVDMAKTLLSYRTHSTSGRIGAPSPEDLLDLGLAKARPITVEPVSAADLKGLAPGLERELPTLPLADLGHAIDCGRAQYLLVFHKDFGRPKGLDTLQKRSSIMGALLRKAQVDGTYYLDGHVVAHPGPGKTAHMFVMRGSGEVSHYGRLTLDAKVPSFTISSRNTRHARPISLSGTLGYGTLDLNFDRAQVATEKSAVQPIPKKPRQLQAALR